MFLNPTETDGFDKVGALLSTFRSELERSGFSGQAEALRGFEVLGRPDAETALMLLAHMGNTSENLDVLKRHIARQIVSVLRQAAA
jgi:hypothetical protein